MMNEIDDVVEAETRVDLEETGSASDSRSSDGGTDDADLNLALDRTLLDLKSNIYQGYSEYVDQESEDSLEVDDEGEEAHYFANVDYNVEDEEIWDIGMVRAQIEPSAIQDYSPMALLFDKLEEYKELPRPDTPTETKLREEPINDVVEEGKEVISAIIEPELEIVEILKVPEANRIDRQALILQITSDLALKEKLLYKNTQLQNKLAEYFKRKRTDDGKDIEKSSSDQEARYLAAMGLLSDLREESNQTQLQNQKIIADYQQKLEEKLAEVDEKTEAFWAYKRTVALKAENSRTGKKLPEKLLDQLEATERRKEKEVIAVRLENIKLKNKLRRHELLLRQKEELADGLHLIDFEQLKIENQTYNEKIEERNEELLRLRKKIATVVQVLTHVKEKLHFIQTQNVDLATELIRLDKEVTQKRDSLPALKNSRVRLKATNTLLRQQNGLLGNEKLLLDYGENVVHSNLKQDEAKRLTEQIAALQRKHSALVTEGIKYRRRNTKLKLTNPIKL